MSGFIAMDEENDSNALAHQMAQQEDEEESVQSGRYGPQYSDSDGELPDEEDDRDGEKRSKMTAPNMWDSWGVLKNYAAASSAAPLQSEDIELNSLHSYDHSPGAPLTASPSEPRPRLDSFDIVDHRKFLSREESEEVEEDDASLRTYETEGSRSQKLIQVAQGPVDEDMHRAWETHLEDIRDNELETLAGWYGDAPKVSPLPSPSFSPPSFLQVTSLHIPIPTREDLDTIEGTTSDLLSPHRSSVSSADENSYPRVRVKVSFSLRVRLFSGSEWPLVPAPPSSTSLAPLSESAPQGGHTQQRSALFKDSSGHRIHKNLAAPKAPKTIKFQSSPGSGRTSASATEISLVNLTLHFRTYDSDLKKRSSHLPQSSIPALKEQVPPSPPRPVSLPSLR
jgi:hypothetical protein